MWSGSPPPVHTRLGVLVVSCTSARLLLLGLPCPPVCVSAGVYLASRPLPWRLGRGRLRVPPPSSLCRSRPLGRGFSISWVVDWLYECECLPSALFFGGRPYDSERTSSKTLTDSSVDLGDTGRPQTCRAQRWGPRVIEAGLHVCSGYSSVLKGLGGKEGGR